MSGVITRAADRAREGFDDTTRGNATWFTFFSGDRTPTNTMSAGVMEVPPRGGALQPHRHQHAEIYYVAEGSGVVTIDGVATPVTAGMAAFIPGDAEHAVRNDSDGVLKIFYVFAADSFAEVVYFFKNPI